MSFEADEPVLFESIGRVARRIASREISPVELARLVLARIERLNPRLNAFVSWGGEALNQARQAEKDLMRKGVLGPLHGIPVSVKDLIHVRGFPTTAGSKVFGAGLKPARDAAAIVRLRRAGAVFVGKTNLHEFAYGVTNENAHFGPARNPWRLERLSGGSSGGSAVAVASRMGFASVGTDTRGSVRIPAACCGITGLKPTLGRISTKGVIPLSWTLDHVGPMARSVEEVALLLQIMAVGASGLDFVAAAAAKPPPLTLGVCEHYLTDLDEEIGAALQQAMELLAREGFRLKRIEMPLLSEALDASGVIASTEALAYHEQHLAAAPESYDPSVRARLEKGRGISGVEAVRAMQIRARALKAFRAAFRECDCLVGAVVPAAPPRVGEDFLRIGTRQVPVVENMVRFNAPQNVAGTPALSIPCGFSRQGLPIGLQLIAWRNQEANLLALGACFQRVTDWHQRRPPSPPG